MSDASTQQGQAQQRNCDGCTLCCKLMPVPSFNNGPDQWCPKCRIGQGCGVYDSRPEDCRAFSCQWLQGAIPLELKPDRVRAVIYTAEEGRRLIVHLDKDRVMHDDIAGYLAILTMKKVPYAIVQGDLIEF